jgi:hypothetical protein
MKGRGTILRGTSAALMIVAMLLAASIGQAVGSADTNWTSYNGTANGQRSGGTGWLGVGAPID